MDFDKVVRWARPERWHTLARRPDGDLPFVGATAESGSALLLDTTVYIDRMQGKAPDVIQALVDVRTVNHSTIAVVELMHTVGRLDPRHGETANVLTQTRNAIRGMPGHRLFEPDAETLGRAAVVAGVLARVQGYASDDRLRALHDCVLFLQALKLGFTVLTGNVRDYDLLLQMVPDGRALLYRKKAREDRNSRKGGPVEPDDAAGR
ncbi:type II toxin-antitoxin system VapC family toxin [Microvirga sp. 2MCAF35]|uniref:type II toxin-antitoxin system VapC family toxin n=1 Tax=Microvirga sp. 2MCAF35 TaxID=3232987 RepID=UPI003F9D18D6